MRTDSNEKPLVLLRGKEVDIDTITNKSLTLEDFRNADYNRAGLIGLLPKLDSKSLAEVSRDILYKRNLKQDLDYTGIIEDLIIPLLVDRILE